MARPHPALRGVGTMLVLVPLVTTLAVGLSSAGSRSTSSRQERTAAAVRVAPRGDLHPGLVEVRPRGTTAGRLLGLAPDGASAAIADIGDPHRARLSIIGTAGSSLQPGLPGVLDAAFSPEGSWLAAIDGHGALWRVSAESGVGSRIAAGPFLGPLTVEPAGTILVSAVSSVHAPFISRLTRVDPVEGSAAVISGETLVYGSVRLADGTIAVVAHRPTGTVVLRLLAGGAAMVAALGPGAIHVSMTADGGTIAFERHGDGVFLIDATSARQRWVGAGSRPRLAPDGRALLVERDGRTVLLATDGSVIADLGGSTAAFAACGDGCSP